MAKRVSKDPEDIYAAAVARSSRYIVDSGIDQSLPAFEFALRFLATYKNPMTMRRYALGLTRYFGWCHQRGADPFATQSDEADIYEGFVGRLGLAPKSVKLDMAIARAFHHRASDGGKVNGNPFAHIRLSADNQVSTEALTPVEINKVLNTIASVETITLLDQRDYALIYVASRVGPRRVELARFRWVDVITTPRGVRGRFHRKGDGIDSIDLPPDAVEVLETWRTVLRTALGRLPRPDEPVFPSVGVGAHLIKRAKRGVLVPMGVAIITVTCRSRFEDAGLFGPRMATHVLRASAATIAFENGATVDEIKIMLGHKNIETTWKYIRRLNRPSPASHWQLDVLPFPGAKATTADSTSGLLSRADLSAMSQLTLFSDESWTSCRRATTESDLKSAETGLPDPTSSVFGSREDRGRQLVGFPSVTSSLIRPYARYSTA